MEFKFHLLPLFAFFCVALLVEIHASSSGEDYWKKLLPNTPMPKAVQDSLKSDASTGVNVGSNGVDVNVGKPGNGVGVHVGKPGNGGVGVNVGKPGNGVGVNVGKPGNGGVGVNVGKPGNGETDVHVGHGETSVQTGPKGKGKVVVIVPGKHYSPFSYIYAANKTQLKDDPNVALFFLEKELKSGTQMNLHFTRTTNGATFLDRKVADSIPFSSDKMSEILVRFDMDPASKEAEVMKETVKECEEKGIEGEDKYCATSLESMVDYTTSKLKTRNVDAISTHVGKENVREQKYVFTGVRKVLGADQAVVCHKQNYAYAVFYCHKTESTKTYMVSLVGADGVKVKAVVVCHTDTSKWNPKHLAFQVLKVEPGTVPICHFLPEDHIVWVRK